ncbi:MAG: chromate transporter [Erysipelotrichaceae bacterium]|nr:chromate transporter [Erysipelotrichaceae bacterium]MDD3809831.1 chromate transporter [Erysipelotrichaceae bacterium]
MLVRLFISFFKIGAFSFGGGMAAIPLVQEQIVTKLQWLTMTQFSDLITLAEMTPGPIAVNSATFVGTKVAGLPGALIATIGCVTPSIMIVGILSFLYYRYKNLSVIQGVLSALRPAVVALILGAGISIFKLMAFDDGINYFGIAIAILGLVLLRKFRFSPILTMLTCGLAGMVGYMFI